MDRREPIVVRLVFNIKINFQNEKMTGEMHL